MLISLFFTRGSCIEVATLKSLEEHS